MLIARGFAYLMCFLLRHSGFFSSVTSPKKEHYSRPKLHLVVLVVIHSAFQLLVFFCWGLPWPNYQSPIAFLTSDGQEEDKLGREKSTFTGFVFVQCTQLYFANGFVLLPRLFVAEVPFSFLIKTTLCNFHVHVLSGAFSWARHHWSHDMKSHDVCNLHA